MRIATFTFVALLAITPLAFGQAVTVAVPVYVTSVGAKDGFTDPNKDNADTVRDLEALLRRDAKREVLVVYTEDSAKIVLTVMQRETDSTHQGFFGPSRDRVVHVKFKFGEIETDLRASAAGGAITSSGAWTAAAGKIVKQVRDWVQQNRLKFIAQ